MLGNFYTRRCEGRLAGNLPAIQKKNLPRYFTEIKYRFNRCYDLQNLSEIFYVSVRTPLTPQQLLTMVEIQYHNQDFLYYRFIRRF